MSDIRIVQVDPTTGIVTLGLTDSPREIRGVDLLVQIVVLEFLRNMGRDVFDPTDGSDLRANIGKYNLGADTATEDFKILVVQATRKIQDEIVRDQKGVGDPTERLKTLDILDIALDTASNQGAVRVKIVNEAGDSRDVVI